MKIEIITNEPKIYAVTGVSTLKQCFTVIENSLMHKDLLIDDIFNITISRD